MFLFRDQFRVNGLGTTAYCCCGLVVKAYGWQLLDHQFEPCLRAFMAVAWDAGSEPMVEYIDPDFF
jgi:hypothetical protein